MNKQSKLACSRCTRGTYGKHQTKQGKPLCRDCARVGPKERRPCANACGGRTLKHDVCHACRDPKRPKRRHADLQKGQGCKQCEGQSWRRPEVGKCKCGKRYAPDVIIKDSGLQRRASIFDPGMSTRV